VNSAAKSRVGIVELARHLGLSVSTVSRALNGYADVNALTRERVVAGARALNYLADPLGRNLRAGRTGAVGFVFSPVRDQFIDGFYAPLLSALNETLRRHGYDLIVASAPVGPDERELLRHLVEGRRVDALMFTRTRPDDERVPYLLERGVPFVSLGVTELGLIHPYVEIELERAAEQAFARLHGFGHRRIALAHGPLAYLFCRRFFGAWERSHSRHRLRPDRSLVFEGDHTEAGGYAIGEAILRLRNRPTAVICNNDATAFGLMQALAAHGTLVGREISVIGCDDITMAAFTVPPLTTFRSPLNHIAAAMVDVLLGAIAGETDVAQLNATFRPELVARKSDGPAPLR